MNANVDAERAAAERGIDLDALADKVSHAVTRVPGPAHVLEASDPAYRSRYDASGFSLTLGAGRIGVALSSLRVGNTATALRPRAWQGDRNVAKRTVGAGLTERVTSRAGEVEWDLVLDRPPAGDGDLVARARLDGLAGAPTRTEDAWRLPLSGGVTARLGALVVKDARGQELHRALPTISGESLSLTVPRGVLAGANYPLTLDPTVGPEQPVADPAYGGAVNEQTTPAVAWNGTNFLVVWSDNRSGTTDIYGARVSGAGSVLDPTGFAISTATDAQSVPALAWNGTNFLVVWEDNRAGAPPDIYGARVSGAGSVLDPMGIAISTATDAQSVPALAWNGTNFLVVWEDNRPGASTTPDIYGTRVSAAGSVLDPTGIAISTAADWQSVPAVAWDGTSFLVVWRDHRSGSFFEPDIYGARVSGTGSVLDPTGIAISTATDEQSLPAVAWNGANFLVVWSDHRSGTNYDIYGARVSATGSVLDATGIPVSAAANSQSSPAVAWNGTNFLVVWDDWRSGSCCDVYGARVSGAGSVLDAAGLAISTAAGGQTEPELAWNGTNFLVVWQDGRSGGFVEADIYGTRVSAAGSVLDSTGIAISTSANDQTSPAVAWNGTDFLVVWADRRSGTNYDIYGARVSATGSVLDATGIPISTAANSQSLPAVAWNGTNFLVVWSDARTDVDFTDIFGARVSATGSVLDATGIPISTAASSQSSPAVAWNGTDFLVVWEDGRSGSFIDSDIYGARVSTAGSVLDATGIPITTASFVQYAPAVAWNGITFLVVWSDLRSGSSFDIYGARVNGTGSVLDPTGLAISSAADSQAAPAVASWSEQFLVAWQDLRSGTDYDIYGAGVGPNGTVAQPAGFPISTAAGDQTEPDLAVRYHFLVAWRDRRSGTNYDLYGTRVSPAGAVQEPAGFPVAASARDEGAPTVTGGAGATWRIGYDRFVPEPPYEATRAFLRSVVSK
jgi:hypothetical protein